MNKLVIVLIALVVVMMIGMGFFMYYIFSSAKPAYGEAIVNDDVIGYSTGSAFVTTLKDSRKVIKADIVIEIQNKKEEKILNDFNYRVRDCILTILGNISEDDINSEDFKDNLKVKIKNTLQDMLETVNIKGVYFNEFVIQ